MLTWEQAWNQLQGASPALAAKRLDIERARWELRRQIASRIPNLSFQAGVQDDHATGDTIAGAIIAMPLPIYNCNQGNIEKRAANSRRLNGRCDGWKPNCKADWPLSFANTRLPCNRPTAIASKCCRMPTEPCSLCGMAYGSGEVDYLRLLSAQQNYGRAHLEYLKTLEIVWTRHAQIEGLLTATD